MSDDRPARYRPLPPVWPWEVPVTPVDLICAALASGRPGGTLGPRLDGLPDDVVSRRYLDLRAAVLASAASVASGASGASGQATGADGEALRRLEACSPGTSRTRWQTWVATSGAADDPDVVALARAVWEALGPNEYALVVRGRPQTWRGEAEGRVWLVAALLPCGLAAWAAAESGPGLRVVFAALAVGSVGLVVASLRRRRQRLRRIGGAELPRL